ncbi:hypothetical protein [Nannocystis pusilla]|uniref:hypothetical protein n=1 Tax=Nannocystis pusilla TaxID=889268 RepID=UPI003DA62E1F
MAFIERRVVGDDQEQRLDEGALTFFDTDRGRDRGRRLGAADEGDADAGQETDLHAEALPTSNQTETLHCW